MSAATPFAMILMGPTFVLLRKARTILCNCAAS